MAISKMLNLVILTVYIVLLFYNNVSISDLHTLIPTPINISEYI